MVKALKAAREEYREYAATMTDYERSVNGRELDEQSGKYFQIVANGAIGEWKAAIKRYQDRLKARDREITKEINRWDTSRLNAEIKQVSTLVDLVIAGGRGGIFDGGSPGVSAQLEAIYTEAVNSEDIYKQRAAFEVLRTILPKVTGDDRFPVNRLAKLAQGQLAQLRITEGMVEAEEARGQALSELLMLRDELIDVAQALGQGDPTQPLGTGPFTRALMMVQQDRETGEIKIYTDDEYQLIGGVFYPMNKEKEG